MKQLTKALVERMMEAELTEHLGYSRSDPGAKPTRDRRNGKTLKTVRTDHGPMELELPRDRDGDFEPQLIPKHQREFRGFDDKILSMYALGLSTRQIQEQVKDLYGVDISPELVSRVTDEVKEYLDEWRSRTLEKSYPIVFFDALRANIREGSKVIKKAVHLALAVTWEGKKEILGIWIANNEGKSYWLGIMNELRNRGVKDMLIASVDGLSGFPDAIRTAFPEAEVQLCMVHMVRNSLKYVSYKDRKELAADLKKIYLAATEKDAEEGLKELSRKWDKKYASVSKAWRARWQEVIPFFKFSPELRKVVYTTNAIESVNYTIQRVIKPHLSFPNDEAAMKLIFMALKRIQKRWTMPFKNWGAALNELAAIYGERVPL
jgi:transposase-like protein